MSGQRRRRRLCVFIKGGEDKFTLAAPGGPRNFSPKAAIHATRTPRAGPLRHVRPLVFRGWCRCASLDSRALSEQRDVVEGLGKPVTWQPIHAQHAIERTRVTLGFDQAPPEKLVAKVASGLAARSAELQLAGPASNSTSIMPVGLPQITFQGWSFTRSTPEGQLVEVVNLTPSELIYEVGEYGRWKLFSERLRSVLEPVAHELFDVLSLRATSLEYLDRFVFMGEATDARPAELFASEIVAALPDDVQSGQKLWHLHRGWFQSVDDRAALIHVNVDAQDGEANGRPARSVAILTRSLFIHEEGRDGVETLYNDLDLLHGILIAEFSKCVLPEVSHRVGMGR